MVDWPCSSFCGEAAHRVIKRQMSSYSCVIIRDARQLNINRRIEFRSLVTRAKIGPLMRRNNIRMSILVGIKEACCGSRVFYGCLFRRFSDDEQAC